MPEPELSFKLYCGLSIILFPVYLVLLICIGYSRTKGKRFSTTFYNLLISVGIGDIVAMASFFYMRMRMYLFPEFHWEHRSAYWTAAYGFNQVYYFLFVSCFGSALISLQRYITVCRSTSKLCHLIHRLKFWQILLIHWIPPTIYSLPIVLNSNITYDNPEMLNTLVDPFMIKVATYLSDIFCVISFLVCIISYILVLRLFRNANMTRSLEKELRMTMQVIGPVLAITCAFIYYLLQFIFATTNNTQMIFFMRGIHPLITGFMSYIHPVVYLIFSDDLRKLIWNFFCCWKRYRFEMNTSNVVPITRLASGATT